MFTTVLFLLVIIGVGFFVMNYNAAQKLAENVKQIYSNITVSMKKRVDLINKLMDIAQGLCLP